MNSIREVQQLNKREPDCGTTFTWATKAFGPKSGWLGGWGIIAADVLVVVLCLLDIRSSVNIKLVGNSPYNTLCSKINKSSY